MLYKEGEPIPALFVILSGLVAVVEEVDGEERVIGIHGPRRFLGELNLLTGQRRSRPRGCASRARSSRSRSTSCASSSTTTPRSATC